MHYLSLLLRPLSSPQAFMETPNWTACSLILLVLISCLCSHALAFEESAKSFDCSNGKKIHYRLLLPQDYDANQKYPLLLALPPGNQQEAMVEAGLKLYWRALAKSGKWIIASPAADEGDGYFHTDSKLELLEFANHILQSFPAENDRYHLAGISNGGRSSYSLAFQDADRIQSILLAPGIPYKNQDNKLHRLKEIPIAAYVGELDAPWVSKMQSTHQKMQKLGVNCAIEICTGQEHVLDNSYDTKFIQRLEKARTLRPADNQDVRTLKTLLRKLHRTAASANEEEYFSCYSNEAVFLGSDATERWPIKEFRAFAHPYFAKGKAWSFQPVCQNISLGKGGQFAFFDEILDSEHMGECRGSGVIVLQDKEWKISQYNLTVPVPNELLDNLLKDINGEAQDFTQIIILRHLHTEKSEDKDRPLSQVGLAQAKQLGQLLSKVKIDALFASPYKRSHGSLEELARSKGLQVETRPAKKMEELAEELKKMKNKKIVVCGHSNTVPMLLKALGIEQELIIEEDEYGRIFMVDLKRGQASLIELNL